MAKSKDYKFGYKQGYDRAKDDSDEDDDEFINILAMVMLYNAKKFPMQKIRKEVRLYINSLINQEGVISEKDPDLKTKSHQQYIKGWIDGYINKVRGVK